MSGGYIQSGSTNQGMTVLSKKTQLSRLRNTVGLAIYVVLAAIEAMMVAFSTGAYVVLAQTDLIRVGATLGRRDVISGDNDEIIMTKRHHAHEKVLPVDIRKTTNIHLIVAALIATVTFATCFIVPGGYNGNEGSDQDDIKRGKLVQHYSAAYCLTIIAMEAMLIAFITGMYILVHSKSLAISFCVIGEWVDKVCKAKEVIKGLWPCAKGESSDTSEVPG
ncbi:unnamed protein product [Ilex paraguariensis]|uniref:PGG domain-containing protein n=1 Tax=Ilex paraguariensis TaxID=185542 RepID=A0ABC8S3Q7_9AQUA